MIDPDIKVTISWSSLPGRQANLNIEFMNNEDVGYFFPKEALKKFRNDLYVKLGVYGGGESWVRCSSSSDPRRNVDYDDYEYLPAHSISEKHINIMRQCPHLYHMPAGQYSLYYEGVPVFVKEELYSEVVGLISLPYTEILLDIID